MERRLTAPSDRTTKRLIIGSILVLAIGIPLIVVLYLFDQYHTPGPSLVDRDIKVAEDAVTSNPNLLTARLTLAGAYATNGRLDDAIAQYDQILTAAPDAAAALLGRGAVEIEQGQLDAAAADFNKVADAAETGEMAGQDPQLEAAYFNLGLISLKQGRAPDAVVVLGKALEIKRTDADALNLLGTALLQAGDPKRAITATRQAIALVPIGWCEPYTQLGSAYLALADNDGVAYADGMVALCQDRPADAKAKLAPLTAGAYAVDALVGLGLVAETQNDAAAAQDAYTKALAVDPNDFNAVTGLGRVSGAPSISPGATPSGGPTGGG